MDFAYSDAIEVPFSSLQYDAKVLGWMWFLRRPKLLLWHCQGVMFGRYGIAPYLSSKSHKKSTRLFRYYGLGYPPFTQIKQYTVVFTIVNCSMITRINNVNLLAQ